MWVSWGRRQDLDADVWRQRCLLLYQWCRCAAATVELGCKQFSVEGDIYMVLQDTADPTLAVGMHAVASYMYSLCRTRFIAHRAAE